MGIVILVAGLFAFIPVKQVSTVHYSILSDIQGEGGLDHDDLELTLSIQHDDIDTALTTHDTDIDTALAALEFIRLSNDSETKTVDGDDFTITCPVTSDGCRIM